MFKNKVAITENDETSQFENADHYCPVPFFGQPIQETHNLDNPASGRLRGPPAFSPVVAASDESATET
jgi:hypothetical protein